MEKRGQRFTAACDENKDSKSVEQDEEEDKDLKLFFYSFEFLMSLMQRMNGKNFSQTEKWKKKDSLWNPVRYWNLHTSLQNLFKREAEYNLVSSGGWLFALLLEREME